MIRLERVTKRFPGGQVAVRELTIEFHTGQLTMLVGPSGCGKTTTLKMINRLIEPTEGRILHDDQDVTHIDPVVLRLRMGYGPVSAHEHRRQCRNRAPASPLGQGADPPSCQRSPRARRA